jgi:hypothetical protein
MKYFDFSTEVTSVVVKELNEAKKSIRIAVFQLHNPVIFNALKNKMKEGVKVEILTLPYDSIKFGGEGELIWSGVVIDNPSKISSVQKTLGFYRIQVHIQLFVYLLSLYMAYPDANIRLLELQSYLRVFLYSYLALLLHLFLKRVVQIQSRGDI